MRLFLLLWSVAAWTAFAVVWWRELDPARAVRRRLAEVRRHPEEEHADFASRVLKPALQRLGRLLARLQPEAQQLEVARLLLRAGSPVSVPVWYLLRLASLLPGLFLCLFVPGGLLTGLALLLLGLRLPVFWLQARGRREARLVFRMLPDALDLLVVSVEAGQGFDQALARVAERFPPPLGPAVRRVTNKIRLGRPRREALAELAEEFALPELRQLTQAVAQAEELGVGIGRTLRVQAEGMRVRRRQKAEELAQKAPVKLLVPLILFIFPTLFAVLLAPAFLRFLSLGHHL